MPKNSHEHASIDMVKAQARALADFIHLLPTGGNVVVTVEETNVRAN